MQPIDNAGPALRRRLLLHGPAARIYTSNRANPHTHLFLFSDLLVVALRLGADPSAPPPPAHAAAPSPDPAAVPPGSQFRVQIAIPLVPRVTELITQREGASRRAGEDDDAEDRRSELQEERIRRACHTFEKNASEAIVYLVNHEIITASAPMVAGFLHRCTALNRRQISGFVGSGITGENLHENPTSDQIEQEKQFHQQMWAAFVGQCNIVAVPIDEALRSVIYYCRMPRHFRLSNILLEIVVMEWLARNVEYGPVPGVFIPETKDMALKLAHHTLALNMDLYNPNARGETQQSDEAMYHAFANNFRASVVDDPALASKRNKGKANVLRKRDQPRVVTVMEVPAEHLRDIYHRVRSMRMVTSSDRAAVAPEFDVEWIRDYADVAAAQPLTDDQVAAEIEDIYSDPGFRDGILFNASSDRLPSRFSIDPPAWVRVTVRLPAPDPEFAIVVRVLGPTATAPDGSVPETISILPTPRLSFRTSPTASFVVRPRQVGHFAIHFVPEGPRMRFYRPIPPRRVTVESAFMRQTIQLAYNRSSSASSAEQQQVTGGRHMFGLDSPQTKARWVHALEDALRPLPPLPSQPRPAPDDALRAAEAAAQALASASPSASQPGAAAQQQQQPMSVPQLLAALSAT